MSVLSLVVFLLSLLSNQLPAQNDSIGVITADMFLKIGTLSSVALPEPYLTVRPSVPVVELKDVVGRNGKVFTLQPTVANPIKTNLWIYTQNYEFNISLYLNQSRPTTELLDLAKKVGVPRVKTNGTADANAEDLSADLAAPNRAAIRFLRELLKANPSLTTQNKHAPSQVKNRVVLAVDHVLPHGDKLVFVASLWNKSSVPYTISAMNITYKEEGGVALINRRTSKMIPVPPVFEPHFSKRTIGPEERAFIFYVTERLSPQDKGKYNIVVLEQSGTRNFDFDVPSYIE
jgi:hypothetical protein